MKTRSEKYFLETGHGSISLKGDDFDCAIYFKGKPYALNWSDCEGSIGQYLVKTGIEGYKEDLRQIRYIIDSGLQNNQPIYSQLYPLLQLFEMGEFSLTNYVPEKWEIINFDLAEKVAYYPLEYVYVPTRSLEDLNSKTVKNFEQRIRRGERPIVITASVEKGWCEFVIDGHHKFEAYRKAKKSPNVVNIEKRKSELSLEEGLEILNGKPSLELYKKVKMRYGTA